MGRLLVQPQTSVCSWSHSCTFQCKSGGKVFVVLGAPQKVLQLAGGKTSGRKRESELKAEERQHRPHTPARTHPPSHTRPHTPVAL